VLKGKQMPKAITSVEFHGHMKHTTLHFPARISWERDLILQDAMLSWPQTSEKDSWRLKF